MALNAPPGQPTPRWSPPGDQVPDGVWAFDIQRNGWTPPDEPINPDRTQLVMPPGWQPRGRDMPWQVVMSPPGTPAPPGMYNYTPKSREVHQPGAQAPVDETNLSLVPAGGSPSPPGGATAPVPAPSPPGVPPPGGAGMPAPPPPAPPGAPSPPRPPAPGMHPGGGAPPPTGMMPPGPSPTPLGTPPMLRPPQQQPPTGMGQDRPVAGMSSQGGAAIPGRTAPAAAPESLDPEMIARALLAQLVGVDTTSSSAVGQGQAVGVGAAGDDLTELQTQTLQRDARRYEGTPYVLGGNDPTKGIDCSGFVTSLLRGFGARVPGRPTTTTYRDQLAAPTNWDNIRPGDILLSAANPRDPTSGEHMALYVGGGLMAESTVARNERGGNGVRIRPVQGTNLQPYRMREPVPGLSDATLLAQHAAQTPDAAGGNVQLLSAQGAPQTTNPVARAGESQVPATVPPEIRQPLQQAADAAGVDPALVAAVGLHESGLQQYSRPGVVKTSPAGARGIMQLMPSTARQLGVNPDDPAQNLQGGARYLGAMVSHYHGDVQTALVAYNWGPGNVDQKGVQAAPPESRAYAQQVMQTYQTFRGATGDQAQQQTAQTPSIPQEIFDRVRQAAAAGVQAVTGATAPRTAYAAEIASPEAPGVSGPGPNPLAGVSQAVGGAAQAAAGYVHGQIGANESAEDAYTRRAARAVGAPDPAVAPAAAAAAPNSDAAASPAVAPAAAAAASDFVFNTPEQRSPGNTGQTFLPNTGAPYRPPSPIANDPRANSPALPPARPGFHWVFDSSIEGSMPRQVPDRPGVYDGVFYDEAGNASQANAASQRSQQPVVQDLGSGFSQIVQPDGSSQTRYTDATGMYNVDMDTQTLTPIATHPQAPMTPYQSASLDATREDRQASLAQESARLAEQIRSTDLTDARGRQELAQRLQEHADLVKQNQTEMEQRQAQYEGVSGNTAYQAGIPRQVGGRLVSYQRNPDDPSQATAVDMGEVTPTPGERESARQFDVSRSTLSAADTAQLQRPTAMGGGIFQYNPDTNSMSQIGDVPMTAGDQANLDERKFEFGNLSADQQSTLDEKKYEFGNLSAAQSANLGVEQQRLSQQHEEALLPYEQMTKAQQAQNQIDQQRLGLQQQQFGLDTQKAQNQLEPLPRGGIARVNPFTGSMQMVNAPEPEAEQYMGGYFYTPAGRTVNIGGQTVSGGPNPYAAWTPSQAGYGSWAPPRMQQQSAMQMSGMQGWRPPQPQPMQGWGGPQQQQGWGGGMGGFGGY